MKKLISLIGAAVLSMALLTGCGGTTDTGKSPMLQEKENKAMTECQNIINMCLDEVDNIVESYPEFKSPIEHSGAVEASIGFVQSAKDTLEKLDVDNKENLLNICNELILTYEVLVSEFESGKTAKEINIDDQIDKINALLEK